MTPDLAPPVICLVTDRHQLGGATSTNDVEPLLRLIENAAQAGVDLIQIREFGLADRVLEDCVRRAVVLTNDTATRVIVNDRVDVALAAGAAGVHLKETSMSAERTRSLVPQSWLVGRSVHAVADAKRVTASRAVDYIIVGTVFETRSKPRRIPIGPGGLEAMARAVDVPTLAIGGVTVGRARLVGAAGAAGLAAIAEFVAAGDQLHVVVQKCRQGFDKGRSSLL